MLISLRIACVAAVVVALVSAFVACSGPPCRSQSECAAGSYCVLDVDPGGGTPSGECVSDCLDATDCPAPESSLSRAICTNQGQCRIEALPPRLIVTEPEDDTLFSEGTRTIRVTGTVESGAPAVTIAVDPRNSNGCSGGVVRSVTVKNPEPGKVSALPFVVDRIELDPGISQIEVAATVAGSRKKSVSVGVEVACPGCADIRVTSPPARSTSPGLELDALAGTINPPVQRAIWRVFSTTGDVFDGTLPVTGTAFIQRRLPLFAGPNRVEVSVTGVGDGLGEARCSVNVSSGVARERGLRIVMSWDGPSSDLDLHVIGPQGVFGDPLTSLSSRSPHPAFGGQIFDDFDGLGPEVAIVESIGDGVYGLIVEPVFDGADPGANLLVRVLSNGRSITRGPVGPKHLSADRGEIWVAGTIAVVGGEASWSSIDEVIPTSMPPTSSPDHWPSFY